MSGFLFVYSPCNLKKGIAVETVGDFIRASRILLQDTMTASPRYSDDDFKLALTLALDEAYRIRSDLFIRAEQVDILSAADNYVPPIPRGYKSAFLYYMCGHVQLRDQEDTQDNRASIFLNKFTTQLLSVAA